MIRKEDLRTIIRDQNLTLKEDPDEIQRTSLENIDLESRQALVVTWHFTRSEIRQNLLWII